MMEGSSAYQERVENLQYQPPSAGPPRRPSESAEKILHSEDRCTRKIFDKSNYHSGLVKLILKPSTALPKKRPF